MIRVFTGLPRAGKSYGSVLDIITELERGDRVVFHNLTIDHGEVAIYLKSRGYEPDVSVRLRKIPEDRVRDFWDYASFGPNPPAVKSKRLFVIDEAHVYFDARAWAEIGPMMSVYLTQHGHLNDEVLFITQHPEMIDKRIRLLVAQTTSFRNLKTERWLQFFRPPAWMLWSEYYGIPRHGQKPDAFGKRKLDLRVAKCYQTSVGHGGLGRSGGPETARPTKRLHFGWMSIAALFVVWLISFGPEKLMGWTIGRFTTAAQKQVPEQKVSPAVQVAPKQMLQQPVMRVPAATEEPPAPASLVTRGITTANGKFLILLSDGRTITEEDGPYRKGGRLYWNKGQESAILKR